MPKKLHVVVKFDSNQIIFRDFIREVYKTNNSKKTCFSGVYAKTCFLSLEVGS